MGHARDGDSAGTSRRTRRCNCPCVGGAVRHTVRDVAGQLGCGVVWLSKLAEKAAFWSIPRRSCEQVFKNPTGVVPQLSLWIVYQFRQDEDEYCNQRSMVDNPVRRRKRLDPRFDAAGSRREAQRVYRGVPRSTKVGERALLLFQIASEESADASNLSAPRRTKAEQPCR